MNHAHRIATGLPSTWHPVHDERTGDLLYWRREHSGYSVHPDGEQFRCELDWQQIGGPHKHLTAAIVYCRDHMHACDRVAALQTTSSLQATRQLPEPDVVTNRAVCSPMGIQDSEVIHNSEAT